MLELGEKLKEYQQRSNELINIIAKSNSEIV